MRAFRLTDWHHDGMLVDVPQPDPGPGEVLIRVAGAGACHSDLHLMHDFEPGLLPWGPPFTLGHENAGWVHALGPGVRGIEIGEAVAVYGPWGCGRCHRCLMGMENYCERQAELGPLGGGLGRDGGMAPFMLVPSERLLVPLGDLDPVEAAPLTDAGLTPYHAVKRSLPLLVPGSTAVVIGAGGLGQFAVALLRELSPATVVAIDSRSTAVADAVEAGAHLGVMAGPDAVTQVRDVSRGRGAELVLDVVGSDATLASAAAMVGQLGHLTIVGLGGGTLPVSFFGIPYEASVATTYWGTVPELVEVIALAQQGRIRARIERYELDHTADAYRAMAAGELRGRAVIVPSPTG